MIPKFKVWDKQKEKMFDQSEVVIWFDENGVGIVEDDYRADRLTDFKLLQSTGLLDKNGKEIFEGDVLEILVAIDTETLNGEVVFEDGIFGVKNVLYGWGFEFGLVPLIEVILAKKVIIVGNKFEHPHLLGQE